MVSLKRMWLTKEMPNGSIVEGKKIDEEPAPAHSGAQRQPVRQSFANDFDYSDIVLGKVKDLRMRYKKPVTINALATEMAGKMTRAELIEIMRGLQEAGEIRAIPGQELSYDTY